MKTGSQMIEGRMSTFGGAKDKGMKHEEGLALFEHQECNARPDLFFPRSDDLTEGASKRLKEYALYFAFRFGNDLRPRLQRTIWIFTNPQNKKSVICSLVDWGPAVETGRTFDLSPYAATLLDLKTDDIVQAEPLT